MGGCLSKTGDPDAPVYNSDGLLLLSMSELRKITEDFSKSKEIGEGGFGIVYQAELKVPGLQSGESVNVAVKRLKEGSTQGYEEFLKEIVVMSHIQHPNIVKLLGYCNEGDAVLVYELMLGGSVSGALDDSNNGELDFSWSARLKVAKDCSSALKYLHQMNLVHRDFKASNVLLDQEYNAKVTDLGLVKMLGETSASTRVMGTLGYLDPDFAQTGHLAKSSDVFSYGIFLFELLTGERSESRGINYCEFMRHKVSKRDVGPESYVDSNLEGRYIPRQAQQIAILARSATSLRGRDRPTMEKLDDYLKQIIADELGARE